MNYTNLWNEYNLPLDRDNPMYLFFVGAGFSIALNNQMSDLNGLTEKVEKYILSEKNLIINEPNAQRYIEDVVSKARAEKKRKINIEDILSYCYENNMTSWILKISRAIFYTISQEQSKFSGGQLGDNVKNLLMATSGVKIIVSFNYDTLLEDCLGWDGYGSIWRYGATDNICSNTNMIYLNPEEADHTKAATKTQQDRAKLLFSSHMEV